MRRIAFSVCASILAACVASGAGDTPRATPVRPAPAAAPTTRLVLPSERARGDLDCADLADQAAAQASLRADPRDPDRLDADRDGIACEHLGSPRAGSR